MKNKGHNIVLMKIKSERNQLFKLIIDKYGSLSECSRKIKSSRMWVKKLTDYEAGKKFYNKTAESTEIEKKLIKDLGITKDKYMELRKIPLKEEKDKYSEKMKYILMNDKGFFKGRMKYINDILQYKKSNIPIKNIEEICRCFKWTMEEFLRDYFKNYKLKKKYYIGVGNNKNKHILARLKINNVNEINKKILEKGFTKKDIAKALGYNNTHSLDCGINVRKRAMIINIEFTKAIAYLLKEDEYYIYKMLYGER